MVVFPDVNVTGKESDWYCGSWTSVNILCHMSGLQLATMDD